MGRRELPLDHFCPWREEAEELRAELDAVRAQVDEMRAQLDDDVQIPPDNNRSEAALRVAALGRKNFLFVGHEDADDNIAALYTLVGTCEAHAVDPFAYLRDVLVRVSSHPASEIDALLPHRWTADA